MADMIFLTKLKPEPMGAHDASKAYGINSLVMSADGAAAYLSVKDVPAGTPLTNAEYWKIHTDLSKTKQSVEEAAAKALAARDEMMEIARNLADPVHVEGNPNRVEGLVGGLPFDSVVTVLEPKQAGSWKNLLPYIAKTTKNGVTFETLADGGVHISGTATALTLAEFECNIVLNGNYVFSMGNKSALGDTLQIRLLDSSGSQGNSNITAANVDAYVTMNTSKVIKKFVIRVAASTAYDVTIYPMLEAGTVKTAFEPAGDIFPISGWTDAKLTRTGKNLFSGSPNKLISNGITLEKDRGSEVTVYGSAAITLGMRVFETQLPAGTYTFSIGEIGNVNRFEPCIDGTPIAQLWSGDTWTLTLEAAADVGLNMIVSKDADCGTEDNPTRIKVQLESGADATGYEPYRGEACSADFGRTVYGGRLDWQKGVLKADRAIVVFNGTEAAWVRHDASGLVYINAFSNPELPVQGQGSPYGVSSHYRRTTANNYFDMEDGEFATGLHQFSSITAYAIFKDAKNGASVDAWKAYLAAQAAAGTPVQVVYKLAAPVEIPLMPREIKQLEGTNTLYGDGSIDINGRAKPGAQLISRIEALETAILNA